MCFFGFLVKFYPKMMYIFVEKLEKNDNFFLLQIPNGLKVVASQGQLHLSPDNGLVFVRWGSVTRCSNRYRKYWQLIFDYIHRSISLPLDKHFVLAANLNIIFFGIFPLILVRGSKTHKLQYQGLRISWYFIFLLHPNLQVFKEIFIWYDSSHKCRFKILIK